MNRDTSALAAEQFDVLIIGGGILGAGIARDAALRGLRVALIDKGDFASGTSSASSKLIHGGFRYLEQRAFRLVRESCRERAILQRIAPHLVRPLPILFPVYDGNRHSLLKIRAGATIYDFFSHDRHETLNPARTRMKEPALNPTGLHGAVMIRDCQEDDARFCLDNILHAAELGAVCANYCELTGFITQEDRIIAARTRDGIEISARTFINATGPWAEHVAGLAPFPNPVRLSPTKGVHLLVPKLTQGHGIIFQASHDDRILFVLPWNECSLVGTTDTDWRGDAGNARAETLDVEYLLSEVNRLLNRQLTTRDILTTFAGVRALLQSDRSPSLRPREHAILRQGRNLINVVGGKYTTYRLIAQQVVDLLSAAPCRTAQTPLPNYNRGGVPHYCDFEMARSVSDVMRRRTSLALSPQGGPETAAQIARLMADHLHWTDTQMYESLQEYLDDRDRASRF